MLAWHGSRPPSHCYYLIQGQSNYQISIGGQFTSLRFFHWFLLTQFSKILQKSFKKNQLVNNATWIGMKKNLYNFWFMLIKVELILEYGGAIG